jgi:MtN3 and saliva related transmembrane protein
MIDELAATLRIHISITLLTTGLGLLAAALTSLSYLPQVRKALPRGSTHDLSLKTLFALTAGLILWCVYGLVRSDYVIVLANVTGAGLTGIVFICKWRDVKSEKKSNGNPR